MKVLKMTRRLAPSMVHKTLGLMALALAGTAHAARPLSTEDSDALTRGDCEWESVATQARATGVDSARGWSTQLGCGVGAGTQLAAAYGQLRQGDDKTRTLALSGKTQLRAREDDSTGVTLAYCLAGSRPQGEAFRTDSSLLNLVLTRASGTVTWHANLGWQRDRAAHQNSATWALAVETSVAEGWDLGVETFGDDRARPWVNSGLRWAASDKLSLNASYGVQWDEPRVKLLTVGVKLAF